MNESTIKGRIDTEKYTRNGQTYRRVVVRDREGAVQHGLGIEMREEEYQRFQENNGSEAACMVCDFRSDQAIEYETRQGEINRSNIPPEEKKRQLEQAKEEYERKTEEVDRNWKEQAAEIMGVDPSEVGESILNSEPLPPGAMSGSAMESTYGGEERLLSHAELDDEGNVKTHPDVYPEDHPNAGQPHPKAGEIVEKDTDNDGIPDQDDLTPGTEDAPTTEDFSALAGHYHDYPEEILTRAHATGDAIDESSNIPLYVKRGGDGVISGADFQGKDNNAYIVFGRDRTGSSIENLQRKLLNSGYGAKQGAGAIDIVVGRGSPFPVGLRKSSGVSAFGEEDVSAKFAVGPQFNTIRPEGLTEYKLKGGKPHPGISMDAARIYISQRTDADYNFGIRDLSNSDDLSGHKISGIDAAEAARNSGAKPPGVKPRSAVISKADQLRFIARHDIKLVTSGPEEKYNSQGGAIQSIEGVHLIAGNGRDAFGKDNPQEPMVKGRSLKQSIVSLADLLHDLAGIIEALLMTQIEFNVFTMTHFHLSPLFGLPTTPSPLLPIIGIKTVIDHVVRAYIGIIFFRINLTTYRMNYLEPTSKTYILSRYNTTN